MSDVLRFPPRDPAPQPIGTRRLRSKVAAVDRTLTYARARTQEFAFAEDDDANGRLRALQSLEIELLDARDQLDWAVQETRMLLELAMDDYTREREKVADLSVARARRAAS